MKDLSMKLRLTVSQVYKWRWDKIDAIKKFDNYISTEGNNPF